MNHQAIKERALEGMTFGPNGDGRRPDIERHAEQFRAEQERRAEPREPRVRQIGWWDDAACKGQRAEVFFPSVTSGPGRHSAAAKALYDGAKAICDRCPVREPCLAASLVEEPQRARHGVRGGMDPDERDLEARMRRMRR